MPTLQEKKKSSYAIINQLKNGRKCGNQLKTGKKAVEAKRLEIGRKGSSLQSSISQNNSTGEFKSLAQDACSLVHKNVFSVSKSSAAGEQSLASSAEIVFPSNMKSLASPTYGNSSAV